MIEDIIKDAEMRMKKSIQAFSDELVKMRTGRAHASLLDHVMVSYYGTDTPLTQIGSVNASDAQTLTVTPWEKNLIPEIEKAILKADLGLNPVTSGDCVRVPMPPLNEERRKEFVKIVKTEAENTRVSIRNIRRDANSDAKELLKDKAITEDDERRLHDRIQKLTDQSIEQVDKHLAEKEKELMEI
ncbi:MAG: ribosome recycling factor [Gammaproteobacteria bacterium]|nr:ribosome recycling factor [Gammaproteobacteria bacterium]